VTASMKKLWYILQLALYACLCVFAHLVIITLLPYPFYALNVALALIMLYIIRTERGGVVWMSFLVGILFDLYATTPFGLYSFCFTFASLLIYWLYTEIFTAQSLWAILLLAFVGATIFRILYLSTDWIFRDILWSDVLVYSATDIVQTSIFTIMLYGILGVYKYKRPLQ